MRKLSYTRRLEIAFLGCGIFMGLIFPFYSEIFVKIPSRTFWLFAVSCVMAGVAVGFANICVYKMILGIVIKRLSENTERISRGSLDFNIDIVSRDHFGNLALSIKSMLSFFSDLVNKLLKSISASSSSSDRMIEKFGEFQENNKQIEHHLHLIVEDSKSQRQNLKSMHGEIDQMSVEIERLIEQNPLLGKEFAIDDGASSQGQKIVVELISDFANLTASINETSQKVASLQGQLGQVEGFVAMIQTISNQTNLLALNASIEAARAGEQGRGFAVVADEVKKLSTETTKSANEIKDLIDNISTLSKELERSFDYVESITEKAESNIDITKSSFDQIKNESETLEKVILHTKDIFSRVHRFNLSSKKSIEEAAEYSAQNASTVENLFALNEEQVEKVRNLSQHIKDQHEQASELRSVIEKFAPNADKV